MTTIGVLAVQGAFEEHIKILDKLGVDCVELRKKADLSARQLDGLVLPGGESTVMGKLLHDLDMFNELKQMIAAGLPVLGTCAGMILLAKAITNDDAVHFGLMDIVVKRNAYGRQLGSFQTVSQFADIGPVPMVFIRAPYIDQVGDQVEVLATVDDHIVAAKQGNMIATSFHPELTTDSQVHSYFLSLI